MIPHPIFTVLAAAALSMAMAMVGERSPRERLHAAARLLLSCTMTVLAGSWLMRLIHG